MKHTAEMVNDFFKESLDTIKTISEGMADIMIQYLKENGSDFGSHKLISFEKDVIIKDENENAIEVSGLEVIDYYDQLYLTVNGEGRRVQIGDLESLLLLFNAFRRVVILREKKAA